MRQFYDTLLTVDMILSKRLDMTNPTSNISIFVCVLDAKTKALTWGPAGRGGKLGTHLVARSAMPAVAQPVSNHHVVLRVGRAPRHLHGGDGTWKVKGEGFVVEIQRGPHDVTSHPINNDCFITLLFPVLTNNVCLGEKKKNISPFLWNAFSGEEVSGEECPSIIHLKRDC